MNQLAGVGQAAAFDDFVVEVDVRLTVLHEAEQQGADVAAEQLAGVDRHTAGEISGTIDGDTSAHHRLTRFGELYVPTGVGRQVDDHRTRSHPRHHVFRHEDGRLAPRHRGGGDDNVGCGDMVTDQLTLPSE